MSEALKNAKAYCVDHKTDILVGGGILTGLISVVTIAVAAAKTVDEYREHKAALEEIETAEVMTDDEGSELAITDDDRKKLKTKENLSYAWTLTKLYALPVAAEAISIFAILAAHKADKQQKEQAIAMAAEAAALATSIAAKFATYRNGVIERYGAQVDYDIYNERNEVEIVTEEVDPKTGKKKKVKRIEVSQTYDPDIYKRVWGPWNSTNWTKNPQKNYASMKAWVSMLQRKVDACGYATYVELMQMFEFDTSVGAEQTEVFIPNSIGWVSHKIFDILPDEWDYKGRHYVKADYSSVIDLNIDANRIEQYNDDVFTGSSDDVWVLRPNCYPIDDILEFAHAYINKKRKTSIAVDKEILKELDNTHYFNI